MLTVDNADRIFSTVVNKSNFTYTVMFEGNEFTHYLSIENWTLSHRLGYILNKMAKKVLNLFEAMSIW